MLERYQRLLGGYRIGNTDLAELPAPGHANRIYSKLEYQNVSGSHYDRVYRVLLEDLESRGVIRPGVTTLLETTSGNAGISCAFMARELGYRCMIFLPASLPENRKRAVAAYGAEVREVGGDNYVADARNAMQAFINEHHERVDGLRVFYSPNHSQQELSCDAVALIATEAVQEVLNRFTCFIGAAGNGTTPKWFRRALRQHNPAIRLLTGPGRGARGLPAAAPSSAGPLVHGRTGCWVLRGTWTSRT
ncbi:MAG: pyridoxal-phosphate dependent enzyme [Candidatus Andersenbacteria bacterium]